MLLICGLGNPGRGHARNRHNIGFMAVDAIAKRHGLGRFRKKFQGVVAEGTVGGERVVALKPMTYMNEAGRAVAAAARFHKVPPGDVIVFHDEIDLPAGRLRVKTGGGHAGHNGLKSIDTHMGPGYRRVRLGISHPGNKQKVPGHVLKNFAKADQAWLAKLLDAIADHVPLLLAGDDGEFMNKVSLVMKPPERRPKPEEGAGDGGDGL